MAATEQVLCAPQLVPRCNKVHEWTWELDCTINRFKTLRWAASIAARQVKSPGLLPQRVVMLLQQRLNRISTRRLYARVSVGRQGMGCDDIVN